MHSGEQARPLNHPPPNTHHTMPPDSPVLDAAVVWVIAVWLAVLGGVIGSFLNVVIYRLPEGMNLSVPASHCPKCKKPIRWYDNVPVLSWIVLRGRCRDCRAPISMRYPLVEAVTAGTFGLLAVVEYASGGANLPPLPPVEIAGLPVETERSSTQLYAIYGYHLVLLCTLLCAVMIEYDGKRLPRSLFYPAAVAGLIAPVIWPQVHPVPAWSGLQGIAAGLIDGPLGLATGACLGLLGIWIWQKKHRRGAVIALSAVGLFLGWQAALVLGLATMAIGLLLRLLGRGMPVMRRIPPTAGLAPVTLAWIVFWAPLVSRGSPL